MKKLENLWQQYGVNHTLNFSMVRERVVDSFPRLTYPKGKVIVYRGDFPDYIYFIVQGQAVGTKYYEDGSQYDYFTLDHTNGSIGLLEVMAKKPQIIATVTCFTDLICYKVPSEIVYDWIMNDIQLLRVSANLLSNDLYRSSRRDGLFNHLEGIDRVRQFMIEYYRQNKVQNGEFVKVNLNRLQIGNQLGLSIRTVSRSYQQLIANGELTNLQRKIYIDERNYERLIMNMKNIE